MYIYSSSPVTEISEKNKEAAFLVFLPSQFYLGIRTFSKDPVMASASTQSSSAASSLGSTQATTMAPIPSYQMLNHTLPVKLDRTNYILWRSQVDNVVFANGFEDFIDGSSICPEKELSPGVLNPAFIAWRRQDRTILSWIYSSLTPAIMAQIIGHNSSHCAWKTLEKTFS
jgi:hypothetical protein